MHNESAEMILKYAKQCTEFDKDRIELNLNDVRLSDVQAFYFVQGKTFSLNQKHTEFI